MLGDILLIPKRGKIPLPTYKGIRDPDIYIQEFINICQAYQEGANAEKLRLFPVILKKKVLEWYTQFPINHFLNRDDIRMAFIQRFSSIKSKGEIINNLSDVKQKKGEFVEEFYKRVMAVAAKIHPAPYEQMKKTWFINESRKRIQRILRYFTKWHLERGIGLCRKSGERQDEKGRMRNDDSSEESSSCSNDDDQRRKKKRGMLRKLIILRTWKPLIKK